MVHKNGGLALFPGLLCLQFLIAYRKGEGLDYLAGVSSRDECFHGKLIPQSLC